MKRFAATVWIALLALALFACSPATSITQEVVPTHTEGFHPLTTRTGIEDVDNIVEVVASGDVEALRSLIQFTNTKCTQQDGLGGPPKCRAGEAEGTPVEVLPIFGPEGYFLLKEEIGKWTGVEATGLYAVYEVSSKVVSDPDYPAGTYAVMFVDKENEAVVSLRLDDGSIVRVDYLLDTSPEELNGWIQREASQVLLAPFNP